MRKFFTLSALFAAAVVVTAPFSVTNAAAAPAPAPPESASIGMNGGAPLMWLPDSQLGADLDAMRSAGSGWVRLDVDWSSIESTRGRQDWSNVDRVVNAARSRGLQVLGIATYTPRWAQDPAVPAGTTHGRPASAGSFGTFAGQAAAHFAGRISAWEIWNEPNLGDFFAPNPDATFYTAMLKSSYSAIHAAVPGATVIGGALSPETGSTAPVSFLQQMYLAGARSATDAVSVHPYSFPALPSDASTASWNTFYRLRDVHDVMASNGDSAKKIWLTEFGAPTGTGAAAVSEQQQAAIIADGLTSARSLSYVGPVFVYEIRDSRTGTNDIQDNFGLLRTDRSAKPAYTVVVAQAVKDGGGTPAPSPGPGPTAPPAQTPLEAFFAAIGAWLQGLLGMLFH